MSNGRYGKKAAAWGLTLCLALGSAAGFAESTVPTDASMLEGMGISTSIEDLGKQLAEVESMTVNAQAAIRQNGEDKVTATALYQFNGDRNYASGTITHANGDTVEMELSTADGTHIARVDDEYFSVPVDADEEAEIIDVTYEGMALSEDTSAYLGTVLNQLFGEVTEKMTITEDGLALHLKGDEVPAILNLALSLADGFTGIEDTAQTHTIMYGKRGEAAQSAEDVDEPLSLGSKLRIASIDLDVATDGEYITGVQFSILLTGIDAEGETVETEFVAVLRMSDINATEPAVVDIEGVEMAALERSYGPSRRMAFPRH